MAKAIVETYLGFPAPDREPGNLDLKAVDAAFATLLSASKPAAPQTIMRFNIHGTLINPDPNGAFVRYEDHDRALAAAVALTAEPMTEEQIWRVWDSCSGRISDFARALLVAAPAAPAQSAEPVTWALRIGDSPSWSYMQLESDADFYGKQSGLKYEKRPLYAAPQSTQPAKAGEAFSDEQLLELRAIARTYNETGFPKQAREFFACVAQSAVMLDDERAAFPLAWQSTFDGLLAYVLQDDLHNRLTPRVIDIAYTAFMSGASGKNKDDGGPCDWFSDTKPVIQEAIAKLSKDLSEARAASPQAAAAQPAQTRALTDEHINAIRTLYAKTEVYEDEGPRGESWQSEALEQARETIGAWLAAKPAQTRASFPDLIDSSEAAWKAATERAKTDSAGDRLPSREQIQALRDHGHGEEAAYWEQRVRDEESKRRQP